MLEVKELTKTYGTMKAADQINFSLPNQTVGILLGPNGAGKSTVIKSIAGLLKYEGEIWIQGREARSWRRKKSLAMCRRYQLFFLLSDGEGAPGVYPKSLSAGHRREGDGSASGTAGSA